MHELVGVECPECGAEFLLPERDPKPWYALMDETDAVVSVHRSANRAVAKAREIRLMNWTIRETLNGSVVASKSPKAL